ncbi:hypothetical protein [Shinella zoogloeoides]|uniref:Uncharacterized protein n=1 Tax=Shinella zoogloeoides TaxID=352475 RepID=A0A6N8TKM9_SHIZO|nr:hypothetical protein [Shinella zoogloeoides]MXO01798.1 hypothetical protein [Shinella zoogloeoides]UEX81102.1 hypothetical protein K8M09_16200 [Shinella zoogloeoides]
MLLAAFSAVGVLLLISFLPFLLKFLGYEYFPSAQWVTDSYLLSLVTGLVLAGLFLAAGARFVYKRPKRGRDNTPYLIILPFVGYALGRFIVLVSIPMIITFVSGYQIAHVFTISKADDLPSGKCIYPISLKELPWFYDTLCYIPEDLRKRMAPGHKIVLAGSGTRMGVFVTTLGGFYGEPSP